jgi:hypothetical protein
LGTAMKVRFGAVALLMAAACCGPTPGTAYPSPPTEALAAWEGQGSSWQPRWVGGWSSTLWATW